MLLIFVKKKFVYLLVINSGIHLSLEILLFNYLESIDTDTFLHFLQVKGENKKEKRSEQKGENLMHRTTDIFRFSINPC